MARRLGDTEYAQGFRFEWSDQRETGELCGWFFPDYPDGLPDRDHKMWIIAIPAKRGEEPSYFVQPGPGEDPGWPIPSLEMAAAYLTGWFNGRGEW
ncbi:hypothetical protein [Kitasatospora sp. NPDC098663]|uniref:hypothetical protein n=1 Tax=Kitasatospora sp. NPDC098663 TaxID=3364096 RepID=UPI0037F478D4